MMNHVKLKQKFLSMIDSSQDKVILQKMFDSGMEIRYDTAKGGYRLKRATMNIADWQKFTKNLISKVALIMSNRKCGLCSKKIPTSRN